MIQPWLCWTPLKRIFFKEAKDAWAKYKGTRELLNLKSLVNYGYFQLAKEKQGARAAMLSLFMGLWFQVGGCVLGLLGF